MIARTSSFALKASGLDARKLSGLLGVRYLLQGSVRRDGDRVRIAAQLVDDSGVQVWSNAYDRELQGIFAIQQDIAEAVATNVVPKIVARSPAEPETLPNLEAYQHYLAGRQIFDKRMPRYAELAEEQFKKAVAIDPNYAEALAELAIVWTFHTSTAQKAEEAIDRALSLKPGLARAHVAKGLMLLEARRPPDVPGAEAAYRQALTLDPNMVDASNWLAGLLANQGRHAERLSILERAARIDPLAPALMTSLAVPIRNTGISLEPNKVICACSSCRSPRTTFTGRSSTIISSWAGWSTRTRWRSSWCWDTTNPAHWARTFTLPGAIPAWACGVRLRSGWSALSASSRTDRVP